MSKIDWFDIEIKGKIYIKLLIFGIVVMLAYLMITFLSFAFPQKYQMDSATVLDENNSVIAEMSEVYRGKIRLKLSGFAYKKGEAVKSFDSYYVLKNIENEKMYKIKTSMIEISELINVDDQYDCSKSGLATECFTFGIKNGIYDIYVLYQNNNENLLVSTGTQVNI